MKKFIAVVALILVGGAGLLLSGCGNSNTYVSCEDKYVLDSSGWRRGVENNEIISNLSTMGLENVAYDFSYVKEQNFGLNSSSVQTFSGAKENSGMKSATLKFVGVLYDDFISYTEYLFTDFSINLGCDYSPRESALELISRQEEEGLTVYSFDAMLKHGSKYYDVNVTYVYSGSNGLISGGEMYVTVPVYLKNKVDLSNVVTQLGEVVETWPGWTHLNYALTPMYKYIPSIYSPYYEIAEVDGLTQIYVPSYTSEMQKFYENELVEAGFVQGDLESCQVLKDIVLKSVGNTFGTKYYTYTMINNVWHIAVYPHSGYMQISAYLDDTRFIEAEELNFDSQVVGTYDSFEEFSKAFRTAVKNLNISVPFGDYDFIDSYYIMSYTPPTWETQNVQSSIKAGFKMKNDIPYAEYQKSLDEIVESVTVDSIYQGAGIYAQGNEFNLSVKINGFDNLYYKYSSNLETYKQSYYDYVFQPGDDIDKMIEAAASGSLIYYPEENMWAFPKNVIGGQTLVGGDESNRVVYDFDYYVTYAIYKGSYVDRNYADVVYADTDLKQNLLSAEYMAGSIDSNNLLIQKQDDYIFMIIFDAETLVDCYKEIIYFDDESARLAFESDGSLTGTERLVTSSGLESLLSQNSEQSKILSLLPKFYVLQTAHQDVIDEVFAKYKGDEAWMFKFVEDFINPTSQRSITSNYSEHLINSPAFSELQIKVWNGDYGLGRWFSISLTKHGNSYKPLLNLNAYLDKNGMLKYHIYEISCYNQNVSDYEDFKTELDGKVYYNYCAIMGEVTPESVLNLVNEFRT